MWVGEPEGTLQLPICVSLFWLDYDVGMHQCEIVPLVMTSISDKLNFTLSPAFTQSYTSPPR